MHSYCQIHNPKRHRLIRQSYAAAATPVFTHLKALQGALQEAVNLELFTIPPYLCALYSIQEGTNTEVVRIIRTVVIEEMLHMMLAANILNAIGGKPTIQYPKYPSPMPHSTIHFTVGLLPFSKKAVNTFLRIERPAAHTGLVPEKGTFWSIGEFYQAVGEALIRLDGEARKTKPGRGIFTGSPENQVTEKHYYGSGGQLFGVYSLNDAKRALDEIVGQGEGIDGSIRDGDDAMFGDDEEFAHYFRFNEIFHEQRYRVTDQPGDAPTGDPLPVDWNAVHNMVPNPKMSMFAKRRGLHKRSEEFNRSYGKLVENLRRGCNGAPEVLMDGIPLMHAMRLAAIDLMNEPCGIGNHTAGPSFEYVS